MAESQPTTVEVDPPKDEFVALPDTPAAPNGVSPQPWGDVGWLPASIQGITGFPPGSTLAFVEWLRNSFADQLPDCVDLLDGIERYYMIADESHAVGQSKTQILLFYGRVDRAKFEACATRAAAQLGGSISRDGALTILGREQPHYVVWAQRGEETLIVYVDSRERLDAILANGPRLDQSPALVELFRRHAFDTRIWTLGLADYGSVLLAVQSTGHAFFLDSKGTGEQLRMRAVGKLLFVSPGDAQKAADAAARLKVEIADLEVEMTGTATAHDDELLFDVTHGADLTPERLEALAEVIEQRREQAGG